MSTKLSDAIVVAACAMALSSVAGPAARAAEEFETVPPGEAAQIDATADLTTRLQDKRAQNDPSQDGRLLRGVHPKSHGCVKARFAINSDIDEDYRVGLFAHPGQTFDAWIRYSNAAVLREDDLKAGPDGQRKSGSRGMAVKVLDVEGEFLSLDNGQQNQDFLMINTPEFAFANVRDYLRLNQILLLSDKGNDATPFFLPLILAQQQKPLPQKGDPVWGDFWVDFTKTDSVNTANTAKIVGQIEKLPVRNPLQIQYFGAAPFLFGQERAMKFSAEPCQRVEQLPFENVTADDPSINYLREALTETMQGQEDICFDFKIQVRGREDLEQQHIENASTVWPDELESYESVARITIPVPQEPDSQQAIEHCEKLAFTPWHSLAAHRPIGGINRLRQKVYSNSAAHRGADGY